MQDQLDVQRLARLHLRLDGGGAPDSTAKDEPAGRQSALKTPAFARWLPDPNGQPERERNEHTDACHALHRDVNVGRRRPERPGRSDSLRTGEPGTIG